MAGADEGLSRISAMLQRLHDLALIECQFEPKLLSMVCLCEYKNGFVRKFSGIMLSRFEIFLGKSDQQSRG